MALRDSIWFVLYLYEKIKKKENKKFGWNKPSFVTQTNKLFLITAFVLSLFGLVSGLKTPTIKETIIYSNKIEKPFNMVVIADLHLNRTLNYNKVQKIISRTNALKPDIILFAGDTIDDEQHFIQPHLDILNTLTATQGIYGVHGNHEHYIGTEKSEKSLNSANIKLLKNEGKLLEKNIFLAGIDDTTPYNNKAVKENIQKSLKDAKENEYKILVSHRPKVATFKETQNVDLIVAAHTHGGQIFPFHFISKFMNKYVSGLYTIEKTLLYVSNGASQWGPQIRIFAPSELSHIIILPNKNADFMKNSGISENEKPFVTEEETKETKETPENESKVQKEEPQTNVISEEKPKIQEAEIKPEVQKEEPQTNNSLTEEPKQQTVEERLLEAKKEADAEALSAQKETHSADEKEVLTPTSVEKNSQAIQALKAENKALQKEVEKLIISVESLRASTEKKITAQKAAIKILQEERDLLKIEVKELKFALEKEKNISKESLKKQRELLLREQKIAQESFRRQKQLADQVKQLKAEINSQNTRENNLMAELLETQNALDDLNYKLQQEMKEKEVLLIQKDLLITENNTLRQQQEETPLMVENVAPIEQAQPKTADQIFVGDGKPAQIVALPIEVTHHPDGSVTRTMAREEIVEYNTHYQVSQQTASYTTTKEEEARIPAIVIENALRTALGIAVKPVTATSQHTTGELLAPQNQGQIVIPATSPIPPEVYKAITTPKPLIFR